MSSVFYSYPNSTGFVYSQTLIHDIGVTNLSYYIPIVISDKSESSLLTTNIYLCSVDGPLCGQLTWDLTNQIVKGTLSVLCVLPLEKKKALPVFVECPIYGSFDTEKPISIFVTPFLKVRTFIQEENILKDFDNEETTRKIRSRLQGKIEIVFPSKNASSWLFEQHFFECRFSEGDLDIS
jgi:hypothetical protein